MPIENKGYKHDSSPETVESNTHKELESLKLNITHTPDALRVEENIHVKRIGTLKSTTISGEFPGREKGKAPRENFSAKSNHELFYLTQHRKLSDDEYRLLFSWFADVRQWYFWDCYLVSTIKSLARSSYFDTLMITSIQKNSDWSFDLYLPLWNPRWKKIHISKEELNFAKIKWSIGYKILEVWFAKEILLRKNWSMLHKWEMPDIKLTEESMDDIIWWSSYFALSTFLWYSDFKRQGIANTPARNRLILSELRKFNPKTLNIMMVSSRRRPEDVSDKQKTYTIWTETMYYHHAYSVYAIEKTGDRIDSVILEDPTNNKKKIKLPLFSFLSAVSHITTCSPRKTFLSAL